MIQVVSRVPQRVRGHHSAAVHAVYSDRTHYDVTVRRLLIDGDVPGGASRQSLPGTNRRAHAPARRIAHFDRLARALPENSGSDSIACGDRAWRSMRAESSRSPTRLATAHEGASRPTFSSARSLRSFRSERTRGYRDGCGFIPLTRAAVGGSETRTDGQASALVLGAAREPQRVAQDMAGECREREERTCSFHPARRRIRRRRSTQARAAPPLSRTPEDRRRSTPA